MSVIKGNLEANITLGKNSCYFMKNGICSLNIITDYYVSTNTKMSANDLLYCPHLYQTMMGRERLKPITIIPCECGHAEVVSGHQRACIASQKGLELAVKAAEDETQEACHVCGGQITFDGNAVGERIVSFRAIILEDK